MFTFTSLTFRPPASVTTVSAAPDLQGGIVQTAAAHPAVDHDLDVGRQQERAIFAVDEADDQHAFGRVKALHLAGEFAVFVLFFFRFSRVFGGRALRLAADHETATCGVVVAGGAGVEEGVGSRAL